MPVRTMRTPQSRSATLPRKVANNSVPDIPVLQCLRVSNRPVRSHDDFVTIGRNCGFERGSFDSRRTSGRAAQCEARRHAKFSATRRARPRRSRQRGSMIDITRRGFLASGAIATGLSAHALESADITWVSDDPYLGGNFAPVGRELDAADLPVIAGRIPPDLSGAYMRNGPNPLFKPISFTYPMDGDGMIHAVYLDNGRARYRNRFVATTSLAVERRAGHAVYGGLARMVRVDP